MFSKDRPAQVDLLLRSMRAFVPAGARTTVLFCGSDDAARRGYAVARAEHAWAAWVDEASAGGFRAALLETLAQTAERIAFLVDDMVFTGPLELDAPSLRALDDDPDVLCCSLRLDPAKRYCYALDRWMTPPALGGDLTWDWPGCDGDWGYPMSTDAHVFRTSELRPLLESLAFTNPNALEARMAEAPLALAKMACVPAAVVTNVPDNRVQDTAPNRHAGGDAAAQTDAFLAGRRLAFDPFAGFRGPAVHQVRALVWDDEPRPRVSVVIPCHDMASTLAEAVESVRASKFDGDVEIIVVDDGSTDGSADIARELGVRLVQRPASGHPAHARNAGFATALGEYVLPLDADDRIDPGFLTATVAALDAHPHAGFAYGDQRDFGDSSAFHVTPAYDFSELPTKNFLGSATLVRHAAWSAVGGYDPDVGYEDWDLWIALGHAGRHGVKAPGAVFEHRVRATGVFAGDLARDRETKARFVLKRPELYGEAQIAWARGVAAGDPAALAVADTVGIVPTFAPAPAPAPAIEARGFAVAALADELVERPELLSAFGRTFGARDDVTLVVYADGSGDELAARLGPVLVATGLDADHAPDLLGIPGGPPQAAAVAARAGALLSGAAPAGPFSDLPCFDEATITDLRRIAVPDDDLLADTTPVTVGPFELCVPADMAWCFANGDFYERNVAAWMDRLVEALGAPVVYDVGANCGYYTLRCTARGARVVAFEPVGATHAVLRANLVRNGLDSDRAIHAAVGAEAGTATINLYSSSGNNSLWERDLPEGHALHQVGTEDVELVTIDDVLAAGGPVPQLLKIDTEGAELSVLRGAERTIATHHPWIVLEYSADTARDAGFGLDELAAELERHGYELAGLSADVDDLRPRTRAEFAAGAVDNVIAIPPGASLPGTRPESAAALPAPAPAAPGTIATRSFTVACLADEVLAEPALLRAFAAAIAPREDASLVIWAGEGAASDVADRVGALVADAGLDAHDLVLVIDPAAAPAVAETASVMLTHRRQAGPLSTIPALGTANIAGLRALAERAWAPALVPRERYERDLQAYALMGGADEIGAHDLNPQLEDNTSTTPYDQHYFFQDVWAARRVADLKPARHMDVGSRIDYVGFLTAICPVTFVDIRPLVVDIEDFECVTGSILDLPFADRSLESVSCLHVVEHIGLGRYGDPLDPLGSRKACAELQRVVAPGGQLLFSGPVGRARTCFNAHRVHDPRVVVAEFFGELELVEFSGVDDAGVFRRHRDISELEGCEYACGMFRLRRRR